MCFRCFASKKPSEQEFFVPDGTDLAVKLFQINMGNNKLATTKNAGKLLAILIAMWMWR